MLAIKDIITEQEETKVAAHTRKKKTYLLQDKLPDNVEIEVIEHKLNKAERNCPECGAVMEEIGQEVHLELVIIPAKVKVLEHHIYSYACQNCKQNNIETHMIRAEKGTALIPGGFATPRSCSSYYYSKVYNGISIILSRTRMEKPWY